LDLLDNAYRCNKIMGLSRINGKDERESIEKMMLYDISIVIVSWNASEHLKNCIESILKNKDGLKIEIIVVDNASIDGSPEMVKKRFPSVKLILNKKNMGFAIANNIGIRASNGNYICLINSDIEVLDNCLQLIMKFMKKNKRIGICGPRIYNTDMSLQRTCREYPTLWNLLCRAIALDVLYPKAKLFGGRMMTYWDCNEVRDVEVLSGCFWMVNRKALFEVGLLDERFFIYAEDVDWCKRYTMAKWRCVYFSEACAIHHHGASSKNAPIRFYLERHRANLIYWQKYYGKVSTNCFISIILIHHVARYLGELLIYYSHNKRDSLYKLKRSKAAIKWVLSHDKEKRITDG
jgi:GT2 family glycosyltransferase